MVGVVGSSPIEPTNEQRTFFCKNVEGHPGYDSANFYRGEGATLVGGVFRLKKSKQMRPRHTSRPHFFSPIEFAR